MKITQKIINDILENNGLPLNSVTVDDLLLAPTNKVRLFFRTAVFKEAPPDGITNINLSILTDGTTIVVNCLDLVQAKAYLSTTLSASTFNIKNFGDVLNVVVKNANSGSTTITLSGSGLKFIDMDNIASPATTVDLTCSNTYNEISLNDSGDTDSGDRVLLVIKK